MTPSRSSARPLSFPVLVADIGGTNVRFGILPQAHSPLRTFPTVQTTMFDSFAQAAEATVLDATSMMPRSLLVALAGPLTSPSVQLTNAHWSVDPAELARTLHLSTVIMFNDFEALALALPYLREDQLLKVGGGEPSSRAPRVVLGPGTGLGVAGLVYGDQRYTPLAGEGGHVSLAPEGERDFALWAHLDRLHGRISAETLLSGDGLARLYRALARQEGVDGDWCREGADATGAAARNDPIADEAIDLFLTYLGRVAGDLALTFLARGGVYIGGGIVPRFADRLATSGFRAAFEAKAPHGPILREIPTYLITEPQPAISGLSSFATLPDRFAMDLSGRRLDV